jgi:hypothetical protein
MRFFVQRIPGYLVGAAVIALFMEYVAHSVFGIPRAAIRQDALGMAACLAAFVATGLALQRRGK